MSHRRSAVLARTGLLLLAVACLLAAVAQAEELPAFRQGLWRFKRTVEGMGTAGKPQTIDTSKCTDPSADMKKQNAMLAKSGCTATPLARSGNTYTFTATCTIEGKTLESKSALTVESDSAYSIEIETTSGSTKSHERLDARRTGDCKP